MKGLRYTALICIVAMGLGGSVLLIPAPGVIGLMYFKGGHYREAKEALERRLSAGDKSVDVVVPLAELYVQSGQVNRAVSLLKTLRVAPSERSSLDREIGNFERFGQFTKAYLQTLEEINRLQKSEDSLRELADLYRYLGQTGRLTETLRTLAANYPGEPSDLTELANLEAVEGHTAKAIDTLLLLERRHPESINTDSVEFLISVLLDSGQTERAVERAEQWVSAQRSPDQAIRFAGMFDARQKPAQGLRLLARFDAVAPDNPALLSEWVHLQVATGQGQAAFERLKSLRRANRLLPELAESFLDLALEQNEISAAIEFAESAGFQHLPIRALLNLAARAMATAHEPFVHRMVARMGEGFLNSRPLLAARISLARGDRARGRKWLLRAASDAALSDEDRLTVAEQERRLGDPAQALNQISRVRLENLSEPELMEAARIYTNLEKVQEGLEHFQTLKRMNRKGEAGWALLATSSGHAHEVSDWLRSAPYGLSEDFLKDLYYAAADHHMLEVALTCARRLYQVSPVDGNRFLLAAALNFAGKPEEALPHLRYLLPRKKDEAVEGTYSQALQSAMQASRGEAGERLRTELRHFWAAKLKSPDQSEKQRLNTVYGLLDIHAWDEALPTLRDLARRHPEIASLYLDSATQAHREGDVVSFLKTEIDRRDLPAEYGEERLRALIEHGHEAVALPYLRVRALASDPRWISIYEEALAKLGQTAELAAFWRSRAAKSTTSVEEKRAIAFRLIEAGHTDWAADIFRGLAQSAKPDDQDVADLLFLWGPKPGPEAIAWLEERARTSSGKERAGWWNRLIEAGAAERVIFLAKSELPPPGDGGVLLDVFLRALAQTGDKRALIESVTTEISALEEPRRIRELSRLARDSGATIAAETGYSRLLNLVPDDAEARHWLGVWAFSRANYSAAEEYLRSLAGSPRAAYDDDFYYAELLWRKRNRRMAIQEYGRALRSVEQLSDPPVEAYVAHAQSLFRVGFTDRAFEEFQALLVEFPLNRDVRADYAALLLESRRYGEAGQLLAVKGLSDSSRLVQLQGQLLMATSQPARALALLSDFTATYPEDARTLAALASIDASAGRDRRARSLIERATILEPEDEDLLREREELDRELSPHETGEFEHRSIQGAQSEDLIRIMGEQMLGAFRLRFGLDQDIASVQSVRSVTGVLAPFQGVLRRGEAAVQREWEDGTRMEVSMYGGGSMPGGGGAITHPDDRGSTTFRIEYERPYWDSAESLAGDGTRDRIQLNRETTIGSRTSVKLGAGWNRYDLKGVSDAATSTAAQATVAVRLNSKPQINLEYTFDGEYRLSVASRTDSAGIQFQPLPWVNREVHSAGLNIAGQLLPGVNVNAAAGFAADRFGGRAPFADVGLSYQSRGRLGAAITYDRRLYFLDTARTVNTLEGRIYFRFK
ncbi:MAG: hypothetical protein JO323_22965 [Acidobacteriia bacterium]|nr:hypothetical protein [Terriglobia bacterium]